jgi:hypothetical protein
VHALYAKLQLDVQKVALMTMLSKSCSAILLMAALTAEAQTAPRLPWNMRETAMTKDGRLTMLQKPWWTRARTLKEGQSFTLDLNHDGRPDTMITRKDDNIIEAIDDSGRAAKIWNQASTTYVVSYNGTGLVDRMVSYIDNNNDGRADEVDLRYYKDGYLRFTWIGECYDGCDASQIFDLKNWQYSGNGFVSRFRGDTQIYLNKYDSVTKTWVPLSECPFSFWDADDTDKEGRSDVVLRVSAAPRSSMNGSDTDYANNYDHMWARETTPLSTIAVVNMRLSFNIDPKPRRDPLNKPHYNFGFTSVGAQPYQYPGMRDTNFRRRPPQTTVHMNWKQGWAPGVHYPSSATGFTWDEARSAWRWEGQFWTYQRIYLSNTGSPTYRWNMRREYSLKPTTERRLYYSAADRRYHLFGAQRGWLEVGHMVNSHKDLEFRWFDDSGDGYLDTVKVYRPESPFPVRVDHFDPRAQPGKLSIEELTKEYNEKILPEAIASDQRFIAELTKVASDPLAFQYEAEAKKTEMPERQRYCLDIARELLFLKVREKILAYESRLPYPNGRVDPAKRRSFAPGSVASGYSLGDSVRFWKLVLLIHKFENEYANGRLEQAGKTLSEIHLK